MQVISQVSEQVEELFGTADDLSLNIKPAPDRWSVAQVLEHLILINESYIPVIRTVRNGQWKPGWLGSRPFMTRFWYRTIYYSIHPDNRKKNKTRPIWEPSASSIEPGIVNRFLQQQEDFKSWITEAQDLVEQNVIIHSPAGKFITYTVGGAIDIMTQHELRHLIQAKETWQEVRSQS